MMITGMMCKKNPMNSYLTVLRAVADLGPKGRETNLMRDKKKKKKDLICTQKSDLGHFTCTVNVADLV